MAKSKSFYTILILGSLAALAPFSIDMYLPGFKSIAKDLNTDVPNVSLSLATFFIGISAGQLLYGPLLDKFGRKKPLYFGWIIFGNKTFFKALAEFKPVFFELIGYAAFPFLCYFTFETDVLSSISIGILINYIFLYLFNYFFRFVILFYFIVNLKLL